MGILDGDALEIGVDGIQAMRQRPTYTFFEKDVTLHSIPAWLQDHLKYTQNCVV